MGPDSKCYVWSLARAPLSLHPTCRPVVGTQLFPELLPHGEGQPEKLGPGRPVSHLSTTKVAHRTKVLPWETEGSSCVPGKSVVSQGEEKPSWKGFEVTASSQFTMPSFPRLWTKGCPRQRTFHPDRWIPWAPELLESASQEQPMRGPDLSSEPGRK